MIEEINCITVKTKTSGFGGVSEICQPLVPLLVVTISSCSCWLFVSVTTLVESILIHVVYFQAQKPRCVAWEVCCSCDHV